MMTRKIYLIGAAAVICILACLGMGFVQYKTYSQGSGDSNADLVARAELCEKKELYLDARELYLQALKQDKKNAGLMLKTATLSQLIGEEDVFLSYCEKALKTDPCCADAALALATYYSDTAQYQESYDVLAALDESCRNEQINDMIASLTAMYDNLFSFYDDAGDWYDLSGDSVLPVCVDGQWGLAPASGSVKLKCAYDRVGAYNSELGVVPCQKNNKCFYSDLNGNKRLVPDASFSYLGAFGEGYAPACLNKLWGYVDKDFTEQAFVYEFTGAFANGVAAVKQNGKWALINPQLNPITDFVYDSILTDSNGFCGLYGTVVAKRDGVICFLNTDGTERCVTAFTEAALPASDDGLIAVSDGKRWGFADKNGNTVIKLRFEEAGSFCCGLAPVKVEDMWGYVNTTGKLMIDPEFLTAGPFCEEGSAVVTDAYGKTLIRLCVQSN